MTKWQKQYSILTNFKSSLLSAINKLASVKTFRSNKELFAGLKLVRVTEVDHCQWGTPTRVMDNVLKL